MNKIKKTKTSKSKPESESSDSKDNKSTPAKFGVLGKDLSSRFSAGGNRTWKPTKRGGRNGNGKP